MNSRTIDVVTDWETVAIPAGYEGLRQLADREFSGAVSAGPAWAFLLNGRIVGVFEGSIEDFEDADATAYRAADPSLPLLFAMRERGGETRANYYTNETPLRDVDQTLESGGFTGYVELSENVLSGDYYVVYHGGKSMSAAFVGSSERLITGEEAFETAADEVGIYEVVDVDVELVDIPDPDPAADAGRDGDAAGGATGGAAAPDAEGSDPDDPPGAAAPESPAEPPADELSDAPDPASDANVDADAPTGADAGPAGTDADPGSGADADADPESGPDTDPISEPDADSDPVSHTDADSDPISRPDADSDPVLESDTGSEPVSEPDTDADPLSQPDTDPDPPSQPGTDADPVSEPDTDADPAAGPGVDSDPDSADRADPSAGGPDAEAGLGDDPAAAEPDPGGDRGSAAASESDREADTGGEPDRSVDAGGTSRDADTAPNADTGTGSEADAAAGRADDGEPLDRRAGAASADDAATPAGPDAPGAPPTDPDAATGRSDPQTGSRPGGSKRDDGALSDEERWQRARTIPSLDPEASTDSSDGSVESAEDRSRSRERTAQMQRQRRRRRAARDRAEPNGADEPDADRADESETVEQLRRQLSEATERVESLEAERDDLRAEYEELLEERDSLRSERDERAERIRELEAECERLRSEIDRLEERLDGDGTDPDSESMSPHRALSGTNLFVRYDSKGQATLKHAHSGEASRSDVRENLRLEHHTTFEAEGVVVDGRPYEEFLRDSTEYAFARWVVSDLLYEIGETGNRSELAGVFDAIPDIDRIELRGDVGVETDDGVEECSFDVVFRDRMGNPLFVADINPSRDATTEAMVGSLVENTHTVASEAETVAAGFYVTESFYEPGALETVAERTGGGFLSRSSKRSFVKLSRKRGYHLCLVEARDGEFHLNVPEL